MHKAVIVSFAVFVLAVTQPKFKNFDVQKFTDKVNKSNVAHRLQRLHLSMHNVTKPKSLPECPPLMEYSDCVCEKSCASPNLVCKSCSQGCNCRQGFLRSDAGRCILPDECTSTPEKTLRSSPRAVNLLPFKPLKLYKAVPIRLKIEPPAMSPTPTSMTANTKANAEEVASTSQPPTSDTSSKAAMGTIKPPSSIPELEAPLIVWRPGPTPPPGPPTAALARTPSNTLDMAGAPSATPPPEFSYGPPGMTPKLYQQLEVFLKRRRVLKALNERRRRLRSRH